MIGLKANLVTFSAMDRLRNLLQRGCRWAAYRLMYVPTTLKHLPLMLWSGLWVICQAEKKDKKKLVALFVL